MKQLFFLVALSACDVVCLAQDSVWRLAGNAGTTNSHFIGTTDNRPLLFRTNNVPSGRIDAAIVGNTFLGYRGMTATTGTNNSLFGYQAGASITTGTRNMAIGYFALNANTTGGYNVAGGSS